MRKITIPVSAVLALSAIPMAQAATIKVDFSKVADHAVGDPGPGELIVDGFTFGGGGKCGFNLDANGKGKSYTIGGRSNGVARTIYFTPKKSGRLTYNLTNGKPKKPNDTFYNAVTTVCSDFNDRKDENTVMLGSLLGGKNGTFSVDLVGGQTYYIMVSESHIFYSISYVEAGPTKDVEVTVKMDENVGTGSIVLNKGTYKLSAANGSLTANIGDDAVTPDAVIIEENNTTVNLTVTLDAKATADTKVAVTAELSSGSLDDMKKVYTQKIAVMINKANEANEYANDTRLQECAVEASRLMAEANGMGITQYDEYVTTGKITPLDNEIAELSAKIDNAKAAYEGYKYAQEEYAKLLPKKAGLDGEYDKVTDKAAFDALYKNAVKALEDFKAAIDAEYAEGKQTDLEAYKSSIDTSVGVVRNTLDEAKNAIANGSGNAISYATVNTAVNDAMARYNTVANELYTLLVGNPEDADTYRNMYVTALGELNTYLRVINEVKAENDALYQAEKCTEDTKKTFLAKLPVDKEGGVDKFGEVYTKYKTRATTLRTNYVNACNDIKENLTGYLESQVEYEIGENRKDVSDHYASQILEIKTSIASIQTNVNNVNKANTIGDGIDAPYYVDEENNTDYAKDKDDVRDAIDALYGKVKASVDEFDYREKSREVVTDLQDKFDEQKKAVASAVSKDSVYNQSGKFSEYESTIQTRIDALLAAADASFDVEVKDGKTAENFFNKIAENQEKDGKVTLYGSDAINANIDGYAAAALAAMENYEVVVAALAEYDLALKGLKDVVTETGVTIYDKFDGKKTYGAYIAEVEEKIKGLQTALNNAVALKDTPHVDAMAALTKFDGLVAEINSLKESYKKNAEKWNAAQLAKAKDSMLKEATRRVGALDTKNVVKNEEYKDKDYNTEVEKPSTNVGEFLENTYGKRYDELNTLLDKCNAAVTAIQTQIKNAEESKDDAAAIATLSTVVDSLAKAEAQYNSLRTLAEEVKTAFSAEKAARKELLVAKDGLIVKLSKEVTFKKDGVNDMFAEERAKMFTENDQSTPIAKLTADIEAYFDAETVVANKQTLVDAKGKIATAINNLIGLVANEQANEAANEAYNTAANELGLAFTAAETAIDNAVADKKAEQGSGAYNYYVNTVLAGYITDYNTNIEPSHNTAYTAKAKVYEADNNTVLSGALNEAKYTDITKNMTAMGAGLKSQLETLKTNVGKVAENLIACETAHSSQTEKAAALVQLSVEVYNIITSAETSSYHDEALAKLQEIDKEIAAYKDAVADAYKIGTNETGKSDIEAKADSVETKLNTLKNGWNDEYSKAVAADNEERKHEFDKAYTSLTKTYAQDVDLIARLSKLSYADKLGGALESVVGKDGIYSYADLIRELKASAEAAYSAAVAPTLFDGAKKFQALAEQYTEEIDSLTTGYTTQVNAAAGEKYGKELENVKKKLKKAKDEVQIVLGDNFVLTTQFQDVQTIIDKAQGYTEKPDFAEYLDNTILPSFATVDSKIAADQLAAAKAHYTNLLTEYRTLANSEATLIAGYHGVDGTLGLYSDDYKSFIERTLDKAEELWAKIDDADKYAKFNEELAADEPKSVKAALDAFGTQVKDAEGQPAEMAVKHTTLFWDAFNADQAYHANDIAYASMQTKIGDVQAELDKANEFVASLIIRNNSNILVRLSNAQGAINDLKGDAEEYHKNEAKDYLEVFLSDCDEEIATIKDITEGTAAGTEPDTNPALLEENTAVEVQIGFLQHDYNQAAAVNIDNEEFDTEHYKSLIAGYRNKNAEILNAFLLGSATAEETRQAFIALETEVGKMKSELTALYNEAAAAEAQAAVQAKIDELTATYDEFVAQLADCHTPVIEKYQPQVDAFKADIDALQAVLNAEAADNTVLLYQDENVKTASAIAKSVENLNLSKNIADMENLYDVNDAKYLELRGQLNTLTERLESVHNAIKEYENKAKIEKDLNGDGEISEDEKYDTIDLNDDGKVSDDEKFSTVYEYRYAQASYYIAKDMEWLNGEYEKKEPTLTSESTFDRYSQAFIDSYISETEQMCAYFNADKTIDALKNALKAAKDDIAKLGYTDADKKNLEATYAELNSKVVSLGDYNYAAYKNNSVTSDIEGNPIVDEKGRPTSKKVVYMEEYPAIMEAAKALKADVATLAEDAVNKSWEKGDVDHNGKITVADYDAVRQMVLELIEYTETDAMFYAADVNEDGLVNIGDVTQIGSKIMENKPFQPVAGASSVAMAKGMAAGMPTYGNLALTADGSGLAQTIKVAVDSRLGFVGGQFDVVLPKGVKLVSVASSSHDALMGEVDGAYRVLVSNLENTEIVNGQAFVELNVEVTSDYDGGGIEVRNVKFADADGTVFNLAKSSISTPTSLTNLTTTEKIQSKVYTVGGMLMNKVKKGINIIVNSDGTTKKQAIE